MSGERVGGAVWRLLILALALLPLACWPLPARAATPVPYAPGFSGRVVQFDLSGFEPDFDPIYRVVIDATLHDGRPAGQAYPDAQLVLSCYLESFQPGTVPVLPDLLHPSQTATDLVGFLHGKAALANAAGKVAYSGSLLAEIFRNNDVHITLQLYDVQASADAPPLQMSGLFTLRQGGTQHGWMRAQDAHPFAALAAGSGPPLSWEAVIKDLAVPTPAMMGGPAGGHAPASPSPGANARPTATAAPVAQQPHGAPAVAAPQRGNPQPRSPRGLPAAVGWAALAAAVGLLIALVSWRLVRRPPRPTPPRTPR